MQVHKLNKLNFESVTKAYISFCLQICVVTLYILVSLGSMQPSKNILLYLLFMQ